MSDVISSLQNPRVKLMYSLQNRPRGRRKENKLVLEGTRLIQDALDSGARPDFGFYTPEAADYELIARLQDRRATLIPVSNQVMQHISDTQQPQGIAVTFPIPAPDLPRHPRRILILDAIQDPGNMGTLLRTAGAAGVELVVLAPGCVDPYNPKVMRAAMGAHFRVPVIEAEWSVIKSYCEGISVRLATGDGDVAYTAVDWTKPWALIIGNEAHGAGSQAGSTASERIAIPMAAATESINAAAAAAVILFEAQRQQLSQIL